MKTSLPIEQQEPNATPSTRREVMKQGLGLSLGSSALGLAGLGASSSAQAWGSYHTSQLSFENFLILKQKLPKFFHNLHKANIVWQNSNDSMTKRGYVVLEGSEKVYLGHFQFNSRYDINKLYKDLNGDVVFSNILEEPRTIGYPGDELRRRLQANDSPPPWSGDIAAIYDASHLVGTPGIIPINHFPITLSSTSGHLIGDFQVSGLTEDRLYDGMYFMVRRLSFKIRRKVTVNGVTEFGPSMTVVVRGHAGGGYGTLTTRLQATYISIPNLHLPDTASPSRNWNLGVDSYSGYAAYQNRMEDIASEYSTIVGPLTINDRNDMLGSGWGTTYPAALATVYSAEDHFRNANRNIILGCALLYFIVASVWRYHQHNSFIQYNLSNNSIRGRNIVRDTLDFFGGDSYRNTQRSDTYMNLYEFYEMHRTSLINPPSP